LELVSKKVKEIKDNRNYDGHTSADVIERLKKFTPPEARKMSVDEIGFIVFKNMNQGYGDDELRDRWTAKHYQSVTKRYSGDVATAIANHINGEAK
jgi:hypothetical protein